jgi:hypothetical protein
MEIICRIFKQLPLEEREYVNQQTGEREKFASMGFVLQSGADRYYAEMLQEQARKQPRLDPNYFYKAYLSADVRSYVDKTGQERHESRLKLNRICLM